MISRISLIVHRIVSWQDTQPIAFLHSSIYPFIRSSVHQPSIHHSKRTVLPLSCKLVVYRHRFRLFLTAAFVRLRSLFAYLVLTRPQIGPCRLSCDCDAGLLGRTESDNTGVDGSETSQWGCRHRRVQLLPSPLERPLVHHLLHRRICWRSRYYSVWLLSLTNACWKRCQCFFIHYLCE